MERNDKARISIEVGETQEKITQAYNVNNPDFAFICGGLRKIAVNPKDRRVRKILLRKGIRYYSNIQLLIYACAKYLPVDVYMDIGTNYGECAFTLPLYSSITVRGYEANHTLHKYLDRSKSYNDDIMDINFAPLAVSNQPGDNLLFYIDTNWSGKSSLILDKNNTNLIAVNVPTTSIDHEISLIGGCNLLLVKLDVEGSEPMVMQGAVKTNREAPNIIYIMEFNSKYLKRGGTEASDFFAYLSDNFPQIYLLSHNYLEPIDSFHQLQTWHPMTKRLHADLVLTRFGDSKIARVFKQTIGTQDLEKVSRLLWN